MINISIVKNGCGVFERVMRKLQLDEFIEDTNVIQIEITYSDHATNVRVWGYLERRVTRALLMPGWICKPMDRIEFFQNILKIYFIYYHEKSMDLSTIEIEGIFTGKELNELKISKLHYLISEKPQNYKWRLFLIGDVGGFLCLDDSESFSIRIEKRLYSKEDNKRLNNLLKYGLNNGNLLRLA